MGLNDLHHVKGIKCRRERAALVFGIGIDDRCIMADNHARATFFPSKRAESCHLTTMAKRFREARVKAGLPEDLVLYCGRMITAPGFLKENRNLAAVMRTMGHKDVKTAMQYQHPELEIVRAALDRRSS